MASYRKPTFSMKNLIKSELLSCWIRKDEALPSSQLMFLHKFKERDFVVGIFVLKECWTNLNLEQTSLVQHPVYKMYVFMLYCQDKLVIKIWRIYLGFIMVLHTHTHTHVDFSQSQFNCFSSHKTSFSFNSIIETLPAGQPFIPSILI